MTKHITITLLFIFLITVKSKWFSWKFQVSSHTEAKYGQEEKLRITA